LLVSQFFFQEGCINRYENIDGDKAVFTGRESCKKCHEKEYDEYSGSDHDLAMDTATAQTVLADFDSSTFTRNGFTSRFYKKGGKFYVYTKGKNGKPAEYQIAYTFGYNPLQQYLVPFDSGRLQCLQIAWDTKRKRWFHLSDSIHKNETIKPDDWLYWTNNGQNWNGMCAECHSTNLKKNYNPRTHIYKTTWSEIDVSCEACHGPASEHLRWAELSPEERQKYPDMGLAVSTGNVNSHRVIDRCAYCHSRRSSFGDFQFPHGNIYDIIRPQLPVPPYYYIDGQILDEDYVYGSFVQSKMYRYNVSCLNCHNPHSLKVKYNGGNRLCLQCHDKNIYDTKRHHFHKYPGEKGEDLIMNGGKKVIAVGEGSKCVNCHMPGRYYMGVDFRRDHSMRIPRPDLSLKLGIPNACTGQCHQNKTDKWAASYTAKWYGSEKGSHFAEIFASAMKNDTSCIDGLTKLVADTGVSPLIRATATMYTGRFQDERSIQALIRSLNDKNPLVRAEAISGFPVYNYALLLQYVAPLLTDSVRTVRINATYALSNVPLSKMEPGVKGKFEKNLKEYIAVMNYSADFAPSRHNLGNIYSNTGNIEKAKENYLEAIRIDPAFYPSLVNLALLYNKTGENDKAEKLFKRVIQQNPSFSEVYYYLGLLSAEKKDFSGSEKYLKKASELLPGNPAVFYNLGLVEQYLDNNNAAVNNLLKAFELSPDNPKYLSAIVSFYLNNGNKTKAKLYLKQWISGHPSDISAKQLLQNIN